ncbi:MAG TPA: site-2 protease family protein [Rhodobacteraceae bacterium]|nr:site-2 protease family protein [Paracoccaceae bacterium]
MKWSWKIARIADIDFFVHATFFILILWIGLSYWQIEGTWAAVINGVGFILVLFACVVAHEFGHAMMARRYGIRTKHITLLPIGGVAMLERMPEDPKQEIAVALAGPAVNVVIAVALWLWLSASDTLVPAEQLNLTKGPFLERVMVINIILAVFNMLPAFPMDGGRVLRAALSIFMDRVRATRVAAGAGQVVALLFGFAGLTGGNPLLILIAVFVFVAANAESQDVAMRAVARSLLARDAMITAYEALTPEDSIATAAKTLIRTTQHEFPVIGQDGTLDGFVTRDALFAALAGEAPRARPVAQIMEPDIPRVALGGGLESVLDLLHKGAPAIAVCDREGHMLGYITRENVGELMVVRGR